MKRTSLRYALLATLWAFTAALFCGPTPQVTLRAVADAPKAANIVPDPQPQPTPTPLPAPTPSPTPQPTPKPTPSGPIVLSGPSTADPYTLVRVSLQNTTSKAIWKISPSLTTGQMIKDRQTFTFVGPPGVYTVSATVGQLVAGELDLQEADLTVTITGTAPTPGPTPQPTPGPVPPKPQPEPSPANKIKAGNLWLICVVPSLMMLTGDQAAIERSSTLRGLVDGKGNHFRLVDPATAPTDLAPYVKLAKGVATGFIVDAGRPEATNIVEHFPLTTEADTTTHLQKWSP